jgi:hypothetical protein
MTTRNRKTISQFNVGLVCATTAILLEILLCSDGNSNVASAKQLIATQSTEQIRLQVRYHYQS